jgi:4-amino-4-deoxy-L-arabinose transferase-like glycosyltransferase
MKKLFNWKFFLLLIVLIAGIFRFWGLSTDPPSLYWDEVSQGYNSYSILKTGFDEHHEFMPIAKFNAFGDYKAPVYIYLDVPFIALFGETPLGVRFPSALLGTLTVFLTYCLVKQMFKSKLKTENLKLKNAIQNLEIKNSLEIGNWKLEILALFSAGLLAISPWHVQLSRAAYEGNVATFFTVLGIYLFFLAKNKHFLWFPLSAISFVLGFYAFNAHRIFIPSIVIALGLFYFKDLLIKKRLAILVGGCVFAIVLLIPFMLYLRTPESKLRFNEVNIFSDSSVIEQSNAWIKEENNTLLADVLHNRRVLFAFSYLKHYFDFFNPNYLFFAGDVNTRFSMQDTGELYLWELPLLIIGLYALFKYKKKEIGFIAVWFILAPVAAATARETPHALRSETYIPIYEIIAAFGLLWTIIFLTKFRPLYRNLAYILFGVIILITTVVAVHNYFAHFPIQYSQDWQYGYKQAVEYAKLEENKYDVISFTPAYGRPYIYLLFYGNITPETYWRTKNEIRDSFGFYNVLSVGKYQFRNSLIDASDVGKRVLYVGAPGQIPANLKVVKTINFLNGKPAFIFAKN